MKYYTESVRCVILFFCILLNDQPLLISLLTLWSSCFIIYTLRHDAPFWRHDEVFDAMVCCLRQDELFVVMTYFFSLFREQNIMKWRIFDFMANFSCIFDVETNLLTSWRVFDVLTNLLRHDVFDVMTSWRIICHHDMFSTSWRTFDAMANVLTAWRIFDVMNFLTSWRTFWRYDVIKLSWQHTHNNNQIHSNI